MTTITQSTPNPSPVERRILRALARGASQREAARDAGIRPRAAALALAEMRDRYAPTTHALIALAVKLEWIELPVWIPKN
jgi:hypothetical protein